MRRLVRSSNSLNERYNLIPVKVRTWLYNRIEELLQLDAADSDTRDSREENITIKQTAIEFWFNTSASDLNSIGISDLTSADEVLSKLILADNSQFEELEELLILAVNRAEGYQQDSDDLTQFNSIESADDLENFIQQQQIQKSKFESLPEELLTGKQRYLRMKNARLSKVFSILNDSGFPINDMDNRFKFEAQLLNNGLMEISEDEVPNFAKTEYQKFITLPDNYDKYEINYPLISRNSNRSKKLISRITKK